MSADTISDILVKTTDLPRVPLADGIDYRVLRTSAETGTWRMLLRAQARSSFTKHRHLGPGDYGCEPLDAVHEETNFPEYSELYFTNHGPIVFLDDDDNLTSILDHSLLTQLAAAHNNEVRTK